jgi:hypothetical protein
MPRMNLQEIQSVTSVNQEGQYAVERRLLPSICEAITLPAYDEIPYMFELKRNEPFEFAFCSDVPIDVLLCSADDYESWVDSGYDPEIALLVHLEAEDVLAYTLRFIVPQDGEYAVVLMNWTECPADIAVEVPDFLSGALR